MFRRLPPRTLGAVGMSGAALFARQTPGLFLQRSRRQWAAPPMRSTVPRVTCPTSAAILKSLRLRVPFSSTRGQPQHEGSLRLPRSDAVRRAIVTPEAYTAITAYILQSNGGVAGPSALTGSTAVPIGNVIAQQKTP